MDKLIICVLISSFSGTMVYGLWLLLGRLWKKTEYLYVAYQSLHTVAFIYFCFVFFGIVYFEVLDRIPGFDSWGFTSPVVHMVLATLSFIWFIGAAVRLAYYLRMYYGHYKYAKNLGPCSSDKMKLLDEMAVKMGIHKKVRAVEGYAFYTAELGGWWNPCIYLPIVDISPLQFQGIVAHELTHYKNGDKWVRELLIIAECIHWFNPVIRRMRRNLEIWDELYCDYCVCRNTYVSHRDYAETLYHMGEIYLNQCDRINHRFGLNVGFCEEENYLLERITRIMRYKDENRNKQRRIIALAVIMVFMCIGTGTAFAAEAGAERMHSMALRGTVKYEMEEYVIQEELEEYVMTPEEAEIFLQKEGAIIESRADSTALINISIKNQNWESGRFMATAEQEISMSVTCNPSNVKVKVGIKDPEGYLRYVYGEGNASHTFALTKTGEYSVFVSNETDTTVKVVGHYTVQTP